MCVNTTSANLSHLTFIRVPGQSPNSGSFLILPKALTSFIIPSHQVLITKFGWFCECGAAIGLARRPHTQTHADMAQPNLILVTWRWEKCQGVTHTPFFDCTSWNFIFVVPTPTRKWHCFSMAFLNTWPSVWWPWLVFGVFYELCKNITLWIHSNFFQWEGFDVHKTNFCDWSM